ncbi:pyrroloquinoline quinone biosynthesis peptide chaperone PqqD [Streptomyces sp. TRM68367]|uniref:pyrroloquinoline quinone biosynthesis peptide chaperone PqqD n=1 Tax=Streptomyces sp. TRM68367 TaxID=2758415 RepID=UPI00165BE818|nr:pyrroloquinoline quinone biosynthesis peptide chaperone PqqD [Streptomyces sp. TRM68367]MBC9727570.1 pyrroloquinoline quinone biosynthesis peptide chaperone PqqD [Streptomyces sp. TRM68367]
MTDGAGAVPDGGDAVPGGRAVRGGGDSGPDGQRGVPGGKHVVPDAGDWSPVLSRSVMLRYDWVRGTDLLVMPERVVVLHGSASAVLRLCDGERTVGAIVAELAERFPGAPVATEVPQFLGRLRDEGWLR